VKKEVDVDKRLRVLGLALLLAGIPVQATWGREDPDSAAAFRFDPAEVRDAKPWTSEDFKNDPYNFQFAILGDRGGGASPLGTYERAIDQLNLLQPEFVMSVGDYVEGYTAEQAEMDEQWEEFEAIVAKLQMPFFHVRGNHDINMPLTRKAWRERRGPKYYHFRYKDVLFIAGIRARGEGRVPG
jgi:hypothetical protein